MPSSFSKNLATLMPGSSTSDSTRVSRSAAGSAVSSPTNPTLGKDDVEGVDDTEVLDEAQGSIILSIIGQLGKGADFHRVTLPTFVLEPRSMLEKLTDNISHPEILFSAVTKQDPLERFVEVVRYYLSGWHVKPKGVKKPYNPVLGEIFRCQWNHPSHNNATSIYVAEQISHHPPISTYYYTCPEVGVEIQGDLRPKSKYLGNSAAVMFHGGARVKFSAFPEEEYEATFPTMYARGILFGTLFLELGDVITIKCPQNDLVCEIEFKVKGFFTGTYNGISGKIRNESTNETLYTISGKWTDEIFLSPSSSANSSPSSASPTRGSNGSEKKNLFFDATSHPVSHKSVHPEIQQEEYESRRLWHQVTKAIHTKDLDAATDEKSAIEDNQRRLQKERCESGAPWVPRFFVHDKEADQYNFKLNNELPADPKQALDALTHRIFDAPESDTYKHFWPKAEN
ncbi:hypothetical protein SmJEL517_g01966 [Synchytrium microbalum]|uniref:Oxysterol-binding protein n=1 Tax=Synchytrium microbalum TaxID=1806994 RepID=A0A507C3V7_9FUNG|nr:uncharacterized protein SmJEL517_g01966 [Synchytrium microbalum]TPX35647.1 hypothetical protein SmJEL517_g01966 [Synchytrium microbalum]